MNKISQKMIEISEKLSETGAIQRSKQFEILAMDLEEVTKMNKLSDSINIADHIHGLPTPHILNALKTIEQKISEEGPSNSLLIVKNKLTDELEKRKNKTAIIGQKSIINIKLNNILTPYLKYKD